MAPKRESEAAAGGNTLTADKALTGILAILVADREARVQGKEDRATDVVLADAGFTYGEIAQLTSRPYETVKSAVRRSRGSAREAA